MMDFTKPEYTNIEKLLKGAISNKDVEFEVRVGSSNRSYETSALTYYQYNNVINHLVFNKKNGGLGLKYKLETQLDIKDEDTDERVTLYGDNNIKKYWLTDDIFDKDVKPTKFIPKFNSTFCIEVTANPLKVKRVSASTSTKYPILL